jgi:isoleucyl-tRNA synthetase
VRSVQSLRKESDFDVADRIELSLYGEQTIRDAFDMFSEYIQRETLAIEAKFESVPEAISINCGDYEAFIAVRQVKEY